MDKKEYEVEPTANSLTVAHKSCSEPFTPTKKPQIHEISLSEANLMSPTPEKSKETVNMRCKKEAAKLPEKHRLLSELFHCMTTSLRLLNLRKQLPTFQNVCRIVEKLSGRKLSYKYLAQMKFILPEVVQTDKILLHNKASLCMEPEIKVTLVFDVIKGHVEHFDYMALSSVFSSRLFKFVNANSEDYVVPEAELPVPFNRKEITVTAMNSSIQIPPNSDETEPLIPAHFPSSFRKCFSTKYFANRMKTQSPMIKDTSLDILKPEKPLNEYTPMKHSLVINEINTVTPDLSTPKRSVATEDKKIKTMINQNEMETALFTKRSLDFSVFDDETTSNSAKS